MLLSKFKFLIVFLIPFSVNAAFSDMDCVHSVFTSKVSHKGAPLGLTNTVLSIQKDKCLITINHEELKFRKNKWVIDICREPIHIKSGTGAVEVIKKNGDCSETTRNREYCKLVKKISLSIQDDGLIFAQGEKEDIQSDHGQLYCTYLILNSYLTRNLIYSRDGKFENTLNKTTFGNDKKTCPVPATSSVQTPTTSIVSPEAGGIEPAPGSPADGAIPDTNEQGRF